MQDQPLPIVCLLGPTGAGKTAAALALSQYKQIEIISLDSALVYRGMDIGTAKPTELERAAVPHHLIDIIDPAHAYSVAQFRQDALQLIDAIRGRGAQPLLVGGTMLYYKALTQGLHDLPPANPEVRAALNDRAEREGWPALHAQLAQHDPVTAARLAPNDTQRIQRALEIWQLTGEPMSALLERPPLASHPTAASQENPPHHFVPIALEPSDRNLWRTRLSQRFADMLKAGLVDEVTQLRTRQDLHPDLPSIRCVGYRQVWAYLEGKMDYEQMCTASITATSQLGKRQLTWLRTFPERHIIDCCAADASQQTITAALDIWDKGMKCNALLHT